MRKKNHQRNNQGGKAARKQIAIKVSSAVKKEETSIILKIQNLINDEIAKTNSMAQNDRNTNLAKAIETGAIGELENKSYVDETAIDSFLDTYLSKFVAFSSDFENENCLIDSDSTLSESENESMKNDEPSNCKEDLLASYDIKKIQSTKILGDSTVNDLEKHNSTEAFETMMNKPLLSLCEAKVKKTISKSNISEKTDILKNPFNVNDNLICKLCSKKYTKRYFYQLHMLKKHQEAVFDPVSEGENSESKKINSVLVSNELQK